MSSIPSAIAVIDTLNAALTVYAKLQQMIDAAKVDGRDNLTLAELEGLASVTDTLEHQVMAQE